jgi:quercetin dioxygenase-like cupin family protein
MLARLGPGGVSFNSQIFHQGCLLPYNAREEDGKITYEVLLPAGASFSPGTHMNHHVSINILWGTGRIVVGDTTYRYEENSAFFIPVGVNHGFVDVEEETAFVKHGIFVQCGAA